MTDRPILFSAPMVRALLDDRKTQTRRILKPQPECGYAGDTPYFSWSGFTGLWPDDWQTAVERNVKIAPSDRLWVKETWRTESRAYDDLAPSAMGGEETILYDADADWNDNKTTGKTRVSIHMPRWASRLTLLVTDVRVERLQDCSVADACAEGALVPPYTEQFANVHALSMYQAIWQGINGPGSWEANPWVAAYTFTVIKQNIDQIERAAA